MLVCRFNLMSTISQFEIMELIKITKFKETQVYLKPADVLMNKMRVKKGYSETFNLLG